jgi:hypothetical protein
VFLAKSAQRQENAGDIANSELRRVCKRLKIKGSDFAPKMAWFKSILDIHNRLKQKDGSLSL